MAFHWTPAIEAQVVDLRDNHEWDWYDIAMKFGMQSADVPRIRYSRRKHGRTLNGGKVEQGTHVPAADVEALDYEIQAVFLTNDYDFDGTTYRFPVNNQVVKIPKATWERIVAAYSGEGANEVQAAIAMDIGMHKKVLEACLRAYGHFKARPPVTREALAAATTDAELEPLYEHAIEVKEAKFSKGLSSYKLREQDRIIHELRTKLHHRDGQKAEMLAALTALLAEPARTTLGVVPHEVDVRAEEFTALVYITDAHFGLRVYGRSGFLSEYNTDISGEYVREVATRTAEWIREQPGRCTTVRVMNGGDVFHAFEKRTRAGTPLERDRPDREVFRHALSAFTDAIETLRTVCDVVEYDGTPGNHDGIHEWFLREALALYFRGCVDVNVNVHERKRTFFLEGSSLHVFDHGEQFTRFDPARGSKAELIARMTGQAFKAADKIYFYCGHTHHAELKSSGPHLTLIRGGTFAHTNDYEEDLVFYGDPEMNVYRLDAKGRIAETKTIFLVDLAEKLELVNAVGQ